jgi:hypothetical protein
MLAAQAMHMLEEDSSTCDAQNLEAESYYQN